MHVRTNGISPASPGPLIDSIPKALREEIQDAFELEGQMQRPAEDRIMEALGRNHAETREDIRGVENRVKEDIAAVAGAVGKLREQFDGTNGTPGVFTRLTRLEDHTGKAATMWRHAKFAAITVIVTASLGFVLGRTLLPNWSPDAERIRVLEQKLKEAEEKAGTAATEQIEPEAVVQPTRTPKRTNKPRRPPGPPLLNRLWNSDPVANKAHFKGDL